jgi:hypothetical protein
MRQLDVPRSYPPTWTDELRIAVLWPGKRWTAPENIDVVSAAADLQGWLTDRRSYEGQHKHGWLSAIADFRHSAGQIGPSLQDALGDDLVAAVLTADSLETALHANSAKALKTLLPTRLPADLEVFEAVIPGVWTGAGGLQRTARPPTPVRSGRPAWPGYPPPARTAGRQRGRLLTAAESTGAVVANAEPHVLMTRHYRTRVSAGSAGSTGRGPAVAEGLSAHEYPLSKIFCSAYQF